MGNILILIKNILYNIICIIDDFLSTNNKLEDNITMVEKFPQKTIDISKHQTSFNAAACRNTGVTTVFCRLAYGLTKDNTFDPYSGGVISGGMKLGCYGFGTWHYKSKATSITVARNIMKEQVNTWINIAKLREISSWFAIDQELEGGQSMALSKSDNTTLLIEAAQLIESYGYKPCLYASASWIIANVDLNRFKYPLWIAYYKWYGTEKDFDNVSEQFPANSGTYGRWMNQYKSQICMWQFSSEGFANKYGCTHGSNGLDKDWLYFGIDNTNTVSAPTVSYFAQYTRSSVSIVEALSAIGENSSYSYRKSIATVNGIQNYAGSPAQNTQMLNMLKNGTLIKP